MFAIFAHILLFSLFYLPVCVMLFRKPPKEFALLFVVSVIGIPVAWLQAGFYLEFSFANNANVEIKLRQAAKTN